LRLNRFRHGTPARPPLPAHPYDVADLDAVHVVGREQPRPPAVMPAVVEDDELVRAALAGVKARGLRGAPPSSRGRSRVGTSINIVLQVHERLRSASYLANVR